MLIWQTPVLIIQISLNILNYEHYFDDEYDDNGGGCVGVGGGDNIINEIFFSTFVSLRALILPFKKVVFARKSLWRVRR